MATLTGNTIASTYTGLLSVTGAVGADTVEAVTDGAGTSTSLSLSQQRATITLGSGAADDFIVDGTTLVVEGDNNRVGIGTASPSTTLDVNGAVNMASTLAIGDAVTVTKAISGSSGDNFLLNIIGTEASGTDLGVGDNVGILFKTAYETTTSKIGSAIVATRESADDTISSTGLAFKVSQNDETLDTALTIDSSGNSTFAGTITTSVDIVIDTAGKGLADEAGNNILERTAGGYITIGDSAWNEVRLNTTGSTDFVLDNSGRIGIGNSSPASGLHLTGGDNTASKFTLTNTAPSPDNVWSIHPEYNSQNLTLNEDSTARVTFQAGGNVGIGEPTPQTNLHISDTATTGVMLSDTNAGSNVKNYEMYSDSGLLAFRRLTDAYSGYSPTMVIKESNVGIGTTSPDATLVVAGAIQGNASDTILNTTSIHIDDTTAWSSLHANKPSGGGINFSGVYNSSNDQVIFAGIRGLKENNTDGNYDGALVLGTIANGGNMTEKMRITSGGQVLFGKTTTSGAIAGGRISTLSSEFTVLDGTVVYFNRQNTDGTIVDLRQGDSSEGTISVSGSTVSYNGFSGNHESSGIPTNTAIGTVVSTIDELDVYPNTDSKTGEAHSKAGETRADHAKIKVSDSVGDKRVYGVLASFNEDNKPIVASVGIGSVKVTGACAGGDLLESNGDGTAKVQDDDIIRSKTIGKVTIGDSDTGVKLVSCVLYCG